MIERSAQNRIATATLWLAACMPQLSEAQDLSSASGSAAIVRTEDPVLDSLNELLGTTSDDQRQSARAVYEHLQVSARQQLLELGKRTLDGRSVLLTTDSEGTTLIENLEELLTQEWNPAFRDQRQAIIQSYLLELTKPGELNQAGFGVCGVGLIYELYLGHPAEAVRLMTGLLGTESKSRTRNGDLLTLAKYVEAPDPTPGRSISEKIFQSALMELANGTEKTYCNHCDEHFNEKNGKIYGVGLYAEQIQSLYESIFGVETKLLDKESSKLADLLSLMQEQTPGFVPVSIRWSSGIAGTKLIRKHITSPHQRGTLGNEPHHILAGGSNRYGPDGNHFILVTSVEDGRVFYRNLHGPSKAAAGSRRTNPPRRIEDPAIGMESMDEKEFLSRLNWVIKVTAAEEQ